MDWGLAGRTAVVTGAAAGIGHGVATELVQAGARVFGVDLSWPDETDELEMDRLTIDVSAREAVHKAVARVVAETGEVAVLVNCAGITRARDDMFEYDDVDWRAVLDINATGLFYCLQAAAEHMVKRGDGAIVNISSIAGRNGRGLSIPYAAAKAAVINITRSTALELAPKGVRVNAVAPGAIDTEFNRRLGAQFGPRQGLSVDEYVEKLAERVPMGRLGTPQDVARVICFLASPFSGYVTGQTINVDGGILMD
ncbi:MAG TPA: glucose 1-dehydrogenase [Galbitalea sp.]|jgi:NAD(P)-dependent dehydrogenase (short-subunit alcohol dehydrogenase family)